MRKLIALVLILVLALPAAAFADDVREVDYYYGYGHIEIAKDGSPYMSIIYFAQDHTCYYLTQMFWHDEPGLGRSYIGTWEYTDNGEVFAKTGNNTSMTLHITMFGSLVDTETMAVYEKFDALMK